MFNYRWLTTYLYDLTRYDVNVEFCLKLLAVFPTTKQLWVVAGLNVWKDGLVVEWIPFDLLQRTSLLLSGDYKNRLPCV